MVLMRTCPYFESTTFKWSDGDETPGIFYCSLREGNFPKNRCIGNPFVGNYYRCELYEKAEKKD